MVNSIEKVKWASAMTPQQGYMIFFLLLYIYLTDDM